MASEKMNTLVRSKTLSFVEKKTLFIGIVANAIFSRRNFKKNEDLHAYINIYESEFNIINVRTKEPGFAKYVYDSRPLLFSRVANKIYKLDDINEFNELVSRHLEFFKNKKTKKDLDRKSKEDKSTSILADMELNNGRNK